MPVANNCWHTLEAYSSTLAFRRFVVILDRIILSSDSMLCVRSIKLTHWKSTMPGFCDGISIRHAFTSFWIPAETAHSAFLFSKTSQNFTLFGIQVNFQRRELICHYFGTRIIPAVNFVFWLSDRWKCFRYPYLRLSRIAEAHWNN